MRLLGSFMAALVPFLLGGCVLPPAFVATSSAGDNATYSETGKSMLDYALSEMLGGDCFVMHGFTRGQFCLDAPKADIVASADTKAETGEAAAPDGGSVFALTAVAAAASPIEPTEPLPSVPVKEEVPVQGEPKWAFVLGAFKDYDQAMELARQLKPTAGIVSSIEVHGEVFYRVTTRPFKLTQAAENEKPVAAAGIPDAKMVAVCPGWMRDETCLVLDGK